MRSAGVKPLSADGGDPSCQLNPTACFDSRTFVPDTQVTVAGVDRSLCFGRDSQIKAYVLLGRAIAKGNYVHLSIPDLITTNYW